MIPDPVAKCPNCPGMLYHCSSIIVNGKVQDHCSGCGTNEDCICENVANWFPVSKPVKPPKLKRSPSFWERYKNEIVLKPEFADD